MNKQQLASLISAQNGITKAQASLAIDQVTNAIGFALEGDDNVTLVGFGTFKRRDKKARQAKNPKTGVVVDVPAKTSISFTPSKTLKQKINL